MSRPSSEPARNDKLVVLLLGETGSGKSTLINYITNYFKEGTLTRPRIAIPTQFYKATESFANSEKDMDDPTKSKTVECTNYDFEANGRRFRFVDSPGLSDTGGVNKDDEHIERITQAAEDAGTLSGMVLVINGTCARVTVNFRNSLSRLRGIMPDVLVDNLIVVLTNCSRSSYNFQLDTLYPWKIKKENVFFMNNSALSRDPRVWQNDSDTRKDMERQWRKSMQQIDDMLERIANLDAKATGVFKNMRQNRNQLKQELHGIILEIDKLQKTQNELEDAERAYHGATNDVQKYSNFTRRREVEYTEQVPASYHSTICFTHKDIVCHENCGLDYNTQANVAVFTNCACMKGGVCSECGCGTAQHYHAKVKLGKRKETVEDILQDVKANYTNASQRADASKRNASKLQSDLVLLQTALHDKHARVEQCCKQLQAICSAFNFADEMNSIVQSMEANARTLTSLHARQEADKMVRSIKQLVEQLKPQNQNKAHDQHYKDFDSGIPETSQPGFQRKGEADFNAYSDNELGARDRMFRNQQQQTSSNRSSKRGNRIDDYEMPESDDDQHPGAQSDDPAHPCPEFNRGQRCTRRPCKFEHQCLLCDGPHGAVDCRSRGGSPAPVTRKDIVNRDEPIGNTTAQLQMMEQMQMQMQMLQQMQLQMMQTTGNQAMPSTETSMPETAQPPRIVGALPPARFRPGSEELKKAGITAANATLVTVGRMAQKKLDKYLKPYVPQ